MADEIKPTQPAIPSPLVSPPPEDRRREQKKPAPRQNGPTEQDKPQQEDGKGEQIDEYV